jgi:hypothetical protein
MVTVDLVGMLPEISVLSMPSRRHLVGSHFVAIGNCYHGPSLQQCQEGRAEGVEATLDVPPGAQTGAAKRFLKKMYVQVINLLE